MPQLDIVCATWNTENRSPEKPEIIKFYAALWKKLETERLDVVVIGRQETGSPAPSATRKRGRGDF